MNLKAMLMLFAWSVILAVIVLIVVTRPLTALAEYHDQLKDTLPAGAGSSELEPYGGCDEAPLYPGTPGHSWCERNGYLK